jgi:hypothetical protein
MVSLFIMASLPIAYANQTFNGTATKCSGLPACSYTITSTSGTSSASTIAGICCYVGQPQYTFSNGYAQYQLPGQTNPTSANGVYSGVAKLVGYSRTVGSIYHVTGTFKVLDANTGTYTIGSTNGYVGQKCVGFRGCGVVYTLLNGSISLAQTNQRASATSVVCNPSSAVSGGSTVCTITVIDPGAGAASTPTGGVTFSQSYGQGTFSASNCTLVSGSCTVTDQITCGAIGSTVVVATYKGDKVHAGSTGSATVTIQGDC